MLLDPDRVLALYFAKIRLPIYEFLSDKTKACRVVRAMVVDAGPYVENHVSEMKKLMNLVDQGIRHRLLADEGDHTEETRQLVLKNGEQLWDMAIDLICECLGSIYSDEKTSKTIIGQVRKIPTPSAIKFQPPAKVVSKPSMKPGSLRFEPELEREYLARMIL